MKRIALTLATVLAFASAVAADHHASDADAVREVVKRAYVEGIHIESDPEKIRSGFHADFVMFVNGDEGVRKVTRDQWIARIEERNRAAPDRPRPEVGHEFTLVDVAGDAAVARVEIHREGRHVYSDYLSLYRFDEGWRIIAKTFYSLPRE